MSGLKDFMLNRNQDFFRWFLKSPLKDDIMSLANVFPEPTRENITNSQALALMDIRDKYVECEKDRSRKKLILPMLNVVIVEVATETAYRHLFEWFIDELVKLIMDGEWAARIPTRPTNTHWKEPDAWSGQRKLMELIEGKAEKENNVESS